VLPTKIGRNQKNLEFRKDWRRLAGPGAGRSRA
jgi:hypothetical protein